MANGILGVLPPGLQGYVAAEQMANQRGQMAQEQARGMLDMQHQAKLRPLQIQAMEEEMAAKRQARENPQPLIKDLGGSFGIFDPRTMKQIGELPKSATPDATLRQQGEMQRHQVPSGSSIYGGNVTMRGQDINAQIARQAQAQQQQNQGQPIYDAERGVFITRPSPIGPAVPQGAVPMEGRQPSVVPVPGLGPKVEKPTDAMMISKGFGDRMAGAEAIMSKPGITEYGKPGFFETAGRVLPGGAGRMAGNAVSSESRQQYRQAQEDWVRAKLRKESGAVIAEDEMNREIETYFPQPFDGQKVIQQKAEARKVAYGGMMGSANPAATRAAAAGPAPSAAPQAPSGWGPMKVK